MFKPKDQLSIQMVHLPVRSQIWTFQTLPYPFDPLCSSPETISTVVCWWITLCNNREIRFAIAQVDVVMKRSHLAIEGSRNLVTLTLLPHWMRSLVVVTTQYMKNFCDFLSSENLLSIRASGIPFTWKNKQKGQFAAQAKKWNRNVFGNLTRKIEDLHGRSNIIQQQLMTSPDSIYLNQQDQLIRNEITALYKEEELLWAQKAKANWLQLGDRNTKFFQAQANIRKKFNAIIKIQDSSGNWATSDVII
ncbi:uncharacterized protein LOC126782821 [Argentina anserina]|uniref:uncharacterized protein LOC126782821 n=1 Tax=Argentina anserina TaxID=57926 RepID=UPI0021761FF6|nr:uncharacterized protein LOC126782821 [Potentilla anserina]